MGGLRVNLLAEGLGLFLLALRFLALPLGSLAERYLSTRMRQ